MLFSCYINILNKFFILFNYFRIFHVMILFKFILKNSEKTIAIIYAKIFVLYIFIICIFDTIAIFTKVKERI